MQQPPRLLPQRLPVRKGHRWQALVVGLVFMVVLWVFFHAPVHTKPPPKPTGAGSTRVSALQEQIHTLEAQLEHKMAYGLQPDWSTLPESTKPTRTPSKVPAPSKASGSAAARRSAHGAAPGSRSHGSSGHGSSGHGSSGHGSRGSHGARAAASPAGGRRHAEPSPERRAASRPAREPRAPSPAPQERAASWEGVRDKTGKGHGHGEGLEHGGHQPHGGNQPGGHAGPRGDRSGHHHHHGGEHDHSQALAHHSAHDVDPMSRHEEARLHRSDADVESELVRRLSAQQAAALAEEELALEEQSEELADLPDMRIKGLICQPGDANCRLAWCKKNLKGDRYPPLRKLGFPIHPSNFTWRELVMHQKDGKKLEGMSKRLLPATAEAALASIQRSKEGRWGRCAIVGNSGVLTKKPYGAAIDKYDVVVRLNQAPVTGYEKEVGKKTTIRLLNRLWSAEYGLDRRVKRLHLPVEPGVMFIASRGEDLLRNYRRLRSYMSTHRKDVKVNIIAFQIIADTRDMLASFRRCLKETGRVFTGGGVPSSGLVAIFALKEFCTDVTAFGFGKASSGRATYQYYRLHGTQRSTGNPTHSFDTEEHLIKALAINKFITFCGDNGCIGRKNQPWG